MSRSVTLLFVALLLIRPAVAMAGPAEDANAAIDSWSAAYDSNDPDAVARRYWPDAILLGTKSPIISQGTDAIKKYFADGKLKGSGKKSVIQERHTTVVDGSAVLVTGFYEFVQTSKGKSTAFPARFTILVTKHGNEWRIANHHSSPRAQAAK